MGQQCKLNGQASARLTLYARKTNAKLLLQESSLHMGLVQNVHAQRQSSKAYGMQRKDVNVRRPGSSASYHTNIIDYSAVHSS
jgi:hypothetical protein